MTLPSRHSERGKTFLFLWNLNARAGDVPAISDFRSLIKRRSNVVCTVGVIFLVVLEYNRLVDWVRFFVQVTIYRKFMIGRDGHLDQSKAYDIS